MSGYVSRKPSRHARQWLQDTEFEAPFAAYAKFLVSRGYKSTSTTRKYLAHAAHFLRWLKRKRHRVGDIDEAMVNRFRDRHLPVCRCGRQCPRDPLDSRSALGRLLELLRGQRWIAPIPLAAKCAFEVELEAFEHHLVTVCGLCEGTCRVYLWHVRRFLLSRFGDARTNINGLTVQDVRRFVERQSQPRQPSSVRSIGVALRSYLRFKALNGATVTPLIEAIPCVARWRLAGLPPTLTQEEIQRLLNAFDPARAAGLRDHAMVRCLTDLGLRAGEVARLQLEDVDWRAGTLTIRGKGRRSDVLPLPRRVGSALAQYLRKGRPRTPSRALFMRLNAPLNKPVQKSTVYAAMYAAACRSGLQDRLTGTHVLRHSVATRLVQRGASLKSIADLLRHRSLDTTTIYAKVDFPALARVALPWPGRLV
jgi:site-specific recombinase XerD